MSQLSRQYELSTLTRSTALDSLVEMPSAQDLTQLIAYIREHELQHLLQPQHQAALEEAAAAVTNTSTGTSSTSSANIKTMSFTPDACASAAVLQSLAASGSAQLVVPFPSQHSPADVRAVHGGVRVSMPAATPTSQGASGNILC